MEPVTPAAIVHITLVLAMKLSLSAVVTCMSNGDPDAYELVNGSCVPRNASSSYHAAIQGHPAVFLTSLLPMVGGLLCTRCFGYISVMQLGGFITLLAAVLIAITASPELSCHYFVLSHALWILPMLSTGITEPAIVYGIILWHRQRPELRQTVCSAMFLCDILGQFLGSQPIVDAISNSSPGMFSIVGSVLYISLAIALQEDAVELGEPQLARPARLLRYVKIFSALTPFFAVVQSDLREDLYANEMKQLTAGGLPDPKVSYVAIFTLFGALVAGTATIVSAWHRRFATRMRIRSGVLLALAVSLSLALFTVVAVVLQPGWRAILAVYLTASACEGVARCLATVAYYEFADSITERRCRPFVFGIMLTVWGVGGALSRLLAWGLASLPTDNPILQPADGHLPLFFVYHAIAASLLGCSLAYQRFLALPLAKMLEPLPAAVREEGEEQTAYSAQTEDGGGVNQPA